MNSNDKEVEEFKARVIGLITEIQSFYTKQIDKLKNEFSTLKHKRNDASNSKERISQYTLTITQLEKKIVEKNSIEERMKNEIVSLKRQLNFYKDQLKGVLLNEKKKNFMLKSQSKPKNPNALIDTSLKEKCNFFDLKSAEVNRRKTAGNNSKEKMKNGRDSLKLSNKKSKEVLVNGMEQMEVLKQRNRSIFFDKKNKIKSESPYFTKTMNSNGSNVPIESFDLYGTKGNQRVISKFEKFNTNTNKMMKERIKQIIKPSIPNPNSLNKVRLSDKEGKIILQKGNFNEDEEILSRLKNQLENFEDELNELENFEILLLKSKKQLEMLNNNCRSKTVSCRKTPDFVEIDLVLLDKEQFS